MGVYINPGNEGFRSHRNSEYIDKSRLIAEMNHTIDTNRRLNCVSRPRRFGKSTAAQMLCAYYDKSCDSSELFDDLEIAKEHSYLEHLNKYDVIYLDMTDIMGSARKKNPVDFITDKLLEEINELYPELPNTGVLNEQLVKAVEHTGNKFIAIIDEWDALMRNRKITEELQWDFLEFLRTLFKSSGKTERIFAAAYMTGILPIKKDGSQSAISDFAEFTMLAPGNLAYYIGFTGEEVKGLCKKYGMDYGQMQFWYDGYFLENGISIYNSNSVMEAIRANVFCSYWSMSASAKNLLSYISLDFDGLSKAAEQLLAGIPVSVETEDFENDPNLVHSKDDVLTLLIHFGYLSYEAKSHTVRIPNEEVRLEFHRSLKKMPYPETIRRLAESKQLIMDTIEGREEAVADQIEKIHSKEYSPLHYNNEQSLRGVIKLAYFMYKDFYIQLEELPAGIGYADVIYLPKRHSAFPALVIELKWEKAVEGAIAQIKKKNYPKVLEGYGSEIILVGISYDRKDGGKKHYCRIEKI